MLFGDNLKLEIEKKRARGGGLATDAHNNP